MALVRVVANVVRLGSEQREFGVALCRASELKGKSLDLRQKVRGDHDTALRAVSLMMQTLTSVDLSQNRIGPRCGEILERAYGSVTPTSLIPQSNIGSEGAKVRACHP